MFDDNSDLSDPPEDEGNGDDAAANGRAEDDAMDVDEAEDVAAANGNANGSSGIVQDDFVEFETVSVFVTAGSVARTANWILTSALR